VGSPSALREANRQRVVDALARIGALSQAALARETGLSRATIGNIVSDLRAAGVVRTSEQLRGSRRVTEVSFHRRAGLVLGIDVDHSHLRVAVADLSHQILAERVYPLDADDSAHATAGTTAEALRAILADLDAAKGEVLGAGMALPAPIDPQTGEVGSTAILPGWTGRPAAAAMSERLGIPVVVDNDANLGALAEVTWGTSRGCRHVVYLKIGSGVGAGLVLDGAVFHGAAGTAGEIGHTSVDENGTLCRCGNRGCLETYVGAEALLTLLRGTQPEVESVADMIRLARDGDAGSQRVLADAGRYIGVAVANLCNLLAPSRVIVGGDMAAAGNLLLEPMRDVVRRHAMRPAADTVEIRVSELGDRSEVLGALALALQENTALSAVLAAAG
jgi:predicted NBD/HSP70 family sugar kinase/biotin operon repressor